MNIEELRDHCLAIKKAEESSPFGDDIIAYKIMNKIFAYFPLTPKEGEHFVILKCDPNRTFELRENYAGITKGVYTGDTLMWNSVYIQRDVPDEMIVELINHSAEEVIRRLPKKRQQEYHTV